MKMTQTCSRCGGRGQFVARYYGNENIPVEKGQMYKDAKEMGYDELVIVEDCNCKEQVDIYDAQTKSEMGELLKLRLEDYKADVPLTKMLKETAEKYLKDPNKMWFTILGKTGTTKTTIGSCIMNAMIDKGYQGLLLRWNDYSRRTKSKIMDDQYEDIFYHYADAQVLLIDDLIKGSRTEADIQQMYDLVDYRYRNGKITIITSEYSLKELAAIDQATTRRIKERSGAYLIDIPEGERL